ncbi:hypothetical protein BRARA_I01837 [Brassica rapa]|uniref:Uncharacterized protein n=1 Tax=Brassica campestris TaxID=3711 RepID=A0A397Y0B3_BRACM|nr:hypothetical protein BRARA_I01837 [Brassica rapa]
MTLSRHAPSGSTHIVTVQRAPRHVAARYCRRRRQILGRRKLLFPSKNLAASQRTHLDLEITSATVVFVFYEDPTIRHLKWVNNTSLLSQFLKLVCNRSTLYFIIFVSKMKIE